MVFYDNFAKPSPSRRSLSIEGAIYYDKHSPTKESCFSPVKQKKYISSEDSENPTNTGNVEGYITTIIFFVEDVNEAVLRSPIPRFSRKPGNTHAVSQNKNRRIQYTWRSL